jgi:hypothetical protein
MAHGVVISLVYFVVANAPRVSQQVVTERYTVRHLDLYPSPSQPRPSNLSGVGYPHLPDAGLQIPAQGSSGVPQALSLKIAPRPPQPQTLVQPELPQNLTIAEETPVPALISWSAQQTIAKTIAPPVIKQAVDAHVRPSIDPPNQELMLADVKIASTEFASTPLILPSTTSPMVQPSPGRPQMVPVTASSSTQKPAPGAVMSVSDLRMEKGTVTIPPSNQTASATSPGVMAPERQGQSLAGKRSDPSHDAKGMGAGNALSGTGDKSTGASNAVGSGGSGNVPAPGGESGAGGNGMSSAVHISLPRDGKFGAVVVGSSVADRYPEIAEIWAGRLTYTVYLHVGLARSWILQYSLPRLDDATASGTATRLEAPWPYSIARPDFAPGAVDADAVMIHGFVNRAGRFESLSVAFPSNLALAHDLLSVLDQWQFRPATQNGDVAKVEILLVIPEDAQ